LARCDLSDPIFTTFLRVSGNQEESAQFMRWLGHRRPETLDLMCLYVGYHQMKMFADCWHLTSHNVMRFIEFWLRKKGVYEDVRDLRFLEKPNIICWLFPLLRGIISKKCPSFPTRTISRRNFDYFNQPTKENTRSLRIQTLLE